MIDIQPILNKLGISELNEMQKEVLKASEQSKSLMLLSPTGSGKTLGFLLPILNSLRPSIKGVQALIMVPSRELALQIEQVFKSMGTGFKVNCCYGGHAMKIERNNLSEPPAVLVGTPGRLADHLRRESFSTAVTHTLVLDEFDKALEFGFQKDMEFIVEELASLDTRMLTSATEMDVVPDFVGMGDYEVINYLGKRKESADLTQKMVRAEGNDKVDALLRLISQLDNEPTIVFCNHRDAVNRISQLLSNDRFEHGVFHGGLEQDERERALIKFRNGSHRLLLTTDLASRGLDIPEIRYVIHYQLPPQEDAFIHRNGRTARMNATGTSYLVLAGDEKIPDFIKPKPQEEPLVKVKKLPPNTDWVTIYVSAGKKDKINKVDIVGLFLQKGGLEKDELGKIEVLDNCIYVSVKRSKSKLLLDNIHSLRLKKKKLRYALAR